MDASPEQLSRRAFSPEPAFMRTFMVSLGCSSALMLLAACHQAECGETERKIGETCYPISPASDASVARRGDDSGQDQIGSGEGIVGSDASGGTHVGAVDSSQAKQPDPENDDGGRDAGAVTVTTHVEDAASPVAPSDAAVLPSNDCASRSEICNGRDDNCNDQIDEGLGQNWYLDCDADGYAAATANGVVACSMPPPKAGCAAWTQRPPGSGTSDCNDQDPTYQPAADFGVAGGGSGDLNCDGVVETRARRVHSPTTVLFEPPADTDFCRNRTTADSCECFSNDSTSGLGPPCAKTVTDIVQSGFVHKFNIDSSGNPTSVGAICDVAITPSTHSTDYYDLLQTCR